MYYWVLRLSHCTRGIPLLLSAMYDHRVVTKYVLSWVKSNSQQQQHCSLPETMLQCSHYYVHCWHCCFSLLLAGKFCSIHSLWRSSLFLTASLQRCSPTLRKDVLYHLLWFFWIFFSDAIVQTSWYHFIMFLTGSSLFENSGAILVWFYYITIWTSSEDMFWQVQFFLKIVVQSIIRLDFNFILR